MAGDAYRIVLLAVGPGLVAGTVSSLLLGYGVGAPNVLLGFVFTYAYLLLWSVAALPPAAIALASWNPRRARDGRRLLAFLVASLWHLLVLEVLSWILDGRSFLLSNLAPILAAYLPATGFTVAAWVLRLRRRVP